LPHNRLIPRFGSRHAAPTPARLSSGVTTACVGPVGPHGSGACESLWICACAGEGGKKVTTCECHRGLVCLVMLLWRVLLLSCRQRPIRCYSKPYRPVHTTYLRAPWASRHVGSSVWSRYAGPGTNLAANSRAGNQVSWFFFLLNRLGRSRLMTSSKG